MNQAICRSIRSAAVLGSLLLTAAAVHAQSDPANFGTVYNIGDVPEGSAFDVPGAVTGDHVGDNNATRGDAGLLATTFLGGDVLGSDSQLNLFDGGSIGKVFRASPLDGTGTNVEVNIMGGTVGESFDTFRGTTINILAGSVGDGFDANTDTTVNIIGGSIGKRATADAHSTVNIFGGSIGSGFVTTFRSKINVYGGNFELNTRPITDLSAGLDSPWYHDFFTGILSDGSAFVFSDRAGDDFKAGTTTLISVAVPSSTNPGRLSSGKFTKGLREEETLTVTGSGTLGKNFAVLRGTLNIEGGSVGTGLKVLRSTVNISGGHVDNDLEAYNSELNISGGSVGDDLVVRGSAVNISGGSVGKGLKVLQSTVNISGGSVGSGLAVGSRQVTVNISGGSIGDRFTAEFGNVNLFGSSFFLDGVKILDLVPGQAFRVVDRNVTLSGFLADGTAFDFDLNRNRTSEADYFGPTARITVTLLVPEPTTAAMLALASLIFSCGRQQRT